MFICVISDKNILIMKTIARIKLKNRLHVSNEFIFTCLIGFAWPFVLFLIGYLIAQIPFRSIFEWLILHL